MGMTAVNGYFILLVIFRLVHSTLECDIQGGFGYYMLGVAVLLISNISKCMKITKLGKMHLATRYMFKIYSNPVATP